MNRPASLGILAKSVNPDYFQNLTARFSKQRTAQNILVDERVNKCLRVPMPNTDHVAIVKSQSGNMSYRNLIVCGSVWHCPVCASKISEYRRNELVEAVSTAKDIGSDVLLLTLTAPHSKGQACGDLVDMMQSARTKFTNRKIWKGFTRAVGLFGSVRAMEVTYGDNGWHVHFHVLLFIKAGCQALAQLWTPKLNESWISATAAVGLVGTNEHGLTLHDGTYAAQYAGKWGIEHELTKGHTKKAKSGFSPFDLLDSVAVDPDRRRPENYRLLFKEYAQAFKGRRQLVWSRGLRDLLLSVAEMSDEEIAQAEEETASVVGRITRENYRRVYVLGYRVKLLQAYSTGDNVAVYLFFHNLDIAWREYIT